MRRRRLKEILSKTLAPEELTYIYSSYDIIGDIAIIRLTETSKKYSQIIAETIKSIHRNVKTVLGQTSPIYGDFRLRKLQFIVGENRKVTIHRESGCLLCVNVEKCYFSPRLSYERMRIAKQIKNAEIVVNMFAGMGSFSVIIAKHSKVKKVFSIDINPAAVQYMQKNIRLNRLYGKIIPIHGDAKEVIKKRLSHLAERVLMPLPEKAFEYLPYALLALKKAEGWIHYYDFEHAKKNENPVEKVKLKVAEKLANLGVSFQVTFGRVVRTTGPNWYQVVLDIAVKQ